MYTLKDFVRRVSPELLNSYLADQNLTTFAVSATEPDALADEFMVGFEKLDYTQTVKIQYHFEQIYTVANEKGIVMLLQRATPTMMSDQPKDFEEWSIFDKAVWFFLKNPDWFAGIADEYEIQNKTGWVTFRTPTVTASIADLKTKQSALSDAVSKYFYANEQRGALCSVDVIERDDYICFVTHPQDFVQREPIYDHTTKKLDRSNLMQPTFKQYFLFRPSENRLSIKTRSGNSKRIDLAGIFGKAIFGQPILSTDQILYDLNTLWMEEGLPAASPDLELERHSVQSLRLKNKASSEIVHISHPNQSDGMELMKSLLQNRRIGRDEFEIIEAKFCVKFKQRQNRIKRERSSVTFTITLPARCDLHENENEYYQRTRRLLGIWGIDKVDEAS